MNYSEPVRTKPSSRPSPKGEGAKLVTPASLVSAVLRGANKNERDDNAALVFFSC
jgi:hypothetical protein